MSAVFASPDAKNNHLSVRVREAKAKKQAERKLLSASGTYSPVRVSIFVGAGICQTSPKQSAEFRFNDPRYANGNLCLNCGLPHMRVSHIQIVLFAATSAHGKRADHFGKCRLVLIADKRPRFSHLFKIFRNVAKRNFVYIPA